MLPRKLEIAYLRDFVNKKGSGFLYLRGRRRVGKSWLLKEFERNSTGCVVFRFTGRLDEGSKRALIQRFVLEWSAFSGRRDLVRIRPSELDWADLFKDMDQFSSGIEKPFVFMIDEIQWIGGSRAGFLGALKEAWIDWERTGRFKVIVCGSSMRFFSEMTGGEEQVLRGLVTAGDLWVLRGF